MLYGATGYTGRLLAHAARDRGMRPILGGRNERHLGELASSLGLEHRVAATDSGLAAALDGVGVVLNAAGPFTRTALPLARACLTRRAHYLDLSGEIDMIEAVRAIGPQAAEAGVMLMTSVGFDVVPSDCLAAHVAARVPGARRLAIGVSGLDVVSRGSVHTLIDQVGQGIKVRRDGVIVTTAPGALERSFDFGGGNASSLAVSWGDVASAFYTTGIPNIEVYCRATAALRALLVGNRLFGPVLKTAPGKSWLAFHAAMLPDGPSAEERARHGTVIVAEADDGAGRVARSRLRAPDAYTFTCSTALAIAERVLSGDFEPGFQTPGRVYGADFPLSFAGVSREDLPS
ncbi:MAG: saccharopine dehydrogenase NADP-binding domain-containing protein [Myxococcales bacterium]